MRTIKQYYSNAILAAFLGSIVTALAYLVWRTLTPIEDISMDTVYWMGAMFGRPGDNVIGLIAHFILGAFIGGIVFCWLSRKLFGPMWLRGAIFGALCWVVVMLALSATQAGMFGKMYSPNLPVAFLVAKLVYGIVTGYLYGKLLAEMSKPADERIGGIHEDRDQDQNHELR